MSTNLQELQCRLDRDNTSVDTLRVIAQLINVVKTSKLRLKSNVERLMTTPTFRFMLLIPHMICQKEFWNLKSTHGNNV